MGAACSNNNQIVSEKSLVNKKGLRIKTDLGPKGRRDEVVRDKDGAYFCNQDRRHEILWKAIEANDLKAAQRFLELNEIETQNMYDPQGQTMLHLASVLGHTDMLMVLLERTSAKPDILNAQLATPLHLACKNNRESVAKFLIESGVDVNIQDEHGQTPLLICCIHGHQSLVSLLIEANNSGQLSEALEVNLANHQGLTPLNCASIKGDLETVRQLVSRGSAKVDLASPKGCTPLIYAGRGGSSEIVEFLIEKKASALKQDNAGGTVLHHAIEKGHTHVLETMLGLGVDVYSAIEIADNGGRTPLFEAVENLQEDSQDLALLNMLIASRSENGFGANLNVCNYSGQTPLFSAVRSGCQSAVECLIRAGASVDLNEGELVKPEEDTEDDFESEEEKYFLHAFKNTMTPLHLACVLGNEDIALLLCENDADPNLATATLQYSALHLSVLANKPEMIIELLSKTNADPYQPDAQGRVLMDLVHHFLPSYVDTFTDILETLKVQRLKRQKREEAAVAISRHNREDERQIAAPKTQQEIEQMYAQQVEARPEEAEDSQHINLNSLAEEDIAPGDVQIDMRIENVFGRKVALCFCSQNWQYKQAALKCVARTTEKYLTRAAISQNTFTLPEIIAGALAAVSLTCRDKVIKVFMLCLQLFNMVVQSPRIERDIAANQKLLATIKQEQLIDKFLQHSESANTRVTNKVHESMLDLSYQEMIGENFVAVAVFDLIRRHNQGQSHKGLLAQLALLFKLVSSFKVHSEEQAGDDSDDLKALTKESILEVVLPTLLHPKEDIRGAATKILQQVQTQLGAFDQQDLDPMPEKVREALLERLKEAADTEQSQSVKVRQKKSTVVSSELPQSEEGPKRLKPDQLDEFKKIVSEKGTHKDWTQRELALNAMNELFNLEIKDFLENEEEFLSQCSIILQTSLNENNIQIYLIAVEVVLSFILKVPSSEAVLDALPGFLQNVVLRTTDTNTRVRKRSVEVVNQIWDIPLNKKSTISASQLIANVLTSNELGEKAIIGRLGLFIKKALLIDSAQDLSKKPLHLILGKDYEQLIQFACSWCLHKNTKVRQCALKLAVEICRLNSLDPRGAPFKTRITNMILGLRSSIRDPLVKKINEVCRAVDQQKSKDDQFIDESELELAQATKARAASYDVRGRASKSTQGNKRPGSASKGQDQALPQIGGGILPRVSAQDGVNRPTIVLPHSEPLNEQQIEQAANLIELFGKELITCFYSQTWSSRLAAIQKVEEQLHNLDPSRRDAMSGEINKQNLPPELTFKSLLDFFRKGLDDPVLKNYICLLDLIQTVLPFYFRFLRGEQLKRDISPLIQVIIQKTSDLKQKVREASMNICLYMSHQSPIGPEHMIQMVLGELEHCQWDKQQEKTAANMFGNSSMIVSCLNLLSQFQLQTQLVTKDSKFYEPYAANINKALKHSNPQVRKEGEALFRTMFATFQDSYVAVLKNQKQQLITKMLSDAKADFAEKQQANTDSETQLKQREISDFSKEPTHDYLSQPQVQALLRGNEEKLQALKVTNPSKRLIAIVDIKKTIQMKLQGLNPKDARDCVEPLSMLLRQLLRDDAVEVYVEALNLLKFIVGSLAPHLSQLDLHLMMGQFLSVIITSQTQNMRGRVASDKVIVYLSKHTNIGSLVVAKEILKNIERINRSLNTFKSQKETNPADEKDEEKKQTLARTYGILQMLLQQFSIVLCYQPDFYAKCLEVLAETMSKAQEEPMLRSTCHQLVVTLFQIDPKLLDSGISNLDFTKKTHLKKTLIELESSNQKGFVNQNLIPNVSGTSRQGSPDASFRDTQQSFTSLASRNSITSPATGPQMNRRLQRDRNSEVRESRDSFMTQTNLSENKWRSSQQEMNPSQTEASWLERRKHQESTLPSITNQVNNSGLESSRRRQVGQGFVGGSNKAAGFNRNEFGSTGEISKMSAFKNQQDVVMGSGIGGNLGALTREEKGMMMGMPPVPKKYSDMMPEEPSSKPPMYVPTQRTAALKRDLTSSGYQPTAIQRMHSQNARETAGTQSLAGLGGQPSLQKQSTLPPAAATFEVKQAQEVSLSQRKNSFL